jgi:hypothetical protein
MACSVKGWVVAMDLSEQLALSASDLRVSFADGAVPVSTAAIAPLDHVTGQDRALEALAFGLSLEADGYNIVVAGPPSSGRNTAVQEPVKAAASAKPPAPDWCYLYNFSDPYRPKAVSMRTGLGGDLRRGMAHLIEVCRTVVPKTFDDESYHERHRQALEHLGEEREGKLAALRRTADEQGFVVQVTPMGFVSVPLAEDGSPMAPEVFNKLAEEERTAFDDRGRVVQEAIGVTVREMRRLEAEERQVVEALGKNVVQYVVRPVLDAGGEQCGAGGGGGGA